MARRKRRRGRRRRTGCAGALIALALIGAFGAYAVPWAVSEYGGSLKEVISTAVRSTVSSALEQQADFPELTVTEEEVAGDFYFQQLSAEEQTVYRELLQGVTAMEERIMLHAGREDSPARVYEYLIYDRPELFWCSGSSQMTVYDDYTEFYPEYTCTAEEKAVRQSEIDSAVSACLSGISDGASDYDRIRYVFEYLVNTVDYDESAPDNQNIYSALVGQRSVCAGYSRAAQYLLKDQGIECIYVIGTAQGQDAHAWNIVNCGGAYYQMDVTFGDPVFLAAENGEALPQNVINYDYLCCTDAEIAADHEQSTEIAYPACVSEDLNYYRMNGMFYESYDPQLLLSAMNDSVYAQESMFVCKFSDASVYEQAYEGVIGELLPEAAQNLAYAYGLERVTYSYVEDETHFKIMIFWDYGQ